MDWNVVHVRINDSATGAPTPARIRFATPDGTYLPPLGRPAQVMTSPPHGMGGNLVLDGKQYAYVEGSFEIRLPAGPLDVEVDKGPDYVPLRQTIVRKMGQMALRLTLERRGDGMAWWLSGDA